MPPLSKEQIESLAEKKLSGAITAEEDRLLGEWLRQECGEQMVWESDDGSEEVLRERLMKRIKEDAGIGRYPVLKRIISFSRSYQRIAAALLLLIAGGAIFLLFFKEARFSPEIAQINEPVHDIPPGHNGAILTLANGNKIVLDSAGNGKMGLQGVAQLVKQNGLLIYEPAVSGAFRRKKGDMGPVAYNTLTTPRGRQFQVVLSDGSKVWLNAASSITYPTAFTGTKREVSITGEAYFEIKNDARHPFIVAAEDEKITVLGTHFNVMAYPDEGQMKTTLVEGSVRISRGTEKVVITPGQQASFSPKTGHIAVMAVQTPEIIAWVSGKLSLNNLDISAIMRRLARWYNVDVEFEGPVPQGHFWGVINRNVNLSSVLSVMNANGIHAQLEGNKVIVSSK